MRALFLSLSALTFLALSSSTVAHGQDIDVQLDEPMPSDGAVIGATLAGTFTGLTIGAALSTGVVFAATIATSNLDAFVAIIGGSISTAPVFGALGAWIGARLVGADVRYDHALAGGMLGAGLGAGLMGLTFLSDNDGLAIAGLFAPPIFLLVGTVVGSFLSHRRRTRATMIPATSFDRHGGTVGLVGMF